MSPTPETPDTARDEGVAKVAELIKDVKVCMLTTTGAAGRLVSRPMAVQEVEFDGDLWFFAEEDSSKVDQVRHGAHVNVAFASGDSWVSVAGDAEVVRDVAKAKELWNPGVEAWFPDGPEAPGIVLVKVHADTAEYWDTPGGRAATLLSYVKSRATGQPYSGGENETVRL
ncbi:pyridoxamine 5'-phosphate oxidase family protein [Pseudokineococcus sp. 5B2Z-1]|uniref:pyridoxamine 5'-phosphate oxidase family protein n=1 Tax=Pseudokineococcus sp. 5B2Z-1 TaxID=3132744 RepID=UPI0030A2C272